MLMMLLCVLILIKEGEETDHLKRFLFSNKSVGGFTVLNTAASYPDLVSGLVLVNASGQFDKPEIEKTEVPEENLIQKTIFNPIRDWFRKVAIGFAYWQAKQPARIRSVLNNVSIPRYNHLILFYLMNASNLYI